jgi:hypothetical protein
MNISKEIAEIKELLEKYKQNEAMLKEKEKAYECLREALRLEKGIVKESDIESIEGSCMQSPVLSYLPRSLTNKFSSKTENAVLDNSEAIHSTRFTRYATKGLQILKFEIAELKDKTSLVLNLTGALKEKHNFIIVRKYIIGSSTEDSRLAYNEMFIFTLEERQFRRNKSRAIVEMAKMLYELGGRANADK